MSSQFDTLFNQVSSKPQPGQSQKKDFDTLFEETANPQVGLPEYIAQRGVKGVRSGWEGVLNLLNLPFTMAPEAKEGEELSFNQKMKDPIRHYLSPYLTKASQKIAETKEKSAAEEGDYVPESELGQIGKDVLGGAAELAGAFSVPAGPLKNLPGLITRGAIGGAAGGLAKTLGAPEPLQMVAEIAGSLPKETAGLLKGFTKPKEAIAKGIASFTSQEKKDLNREIINQFREAGIQADLGTITDNRLVKSIQTKLAQSGLTGDALKKFKKSMTEQIVNNYKNLANQVGKEQFSTANAAGEKAQTLLKSIKEADLDQARNLYRQAAKARPTNAIVPPQAADKVAGRIASIQKALEPGSLKSGEQKKVLDILETVSKDVNKDVVLVDDLINNKLALNEIIDYEAQGGAKQLLKTVVREIDNSIREYGRLNPAFMNRQNAANAKFSQHAKTFRNSAISKALSTENPEQILTQMNTVSGIRKLNDALDKSSGGKQLMKDLKRYKLQEMIGENIVDSAKNEIQLGRFSNLFQKGKGKELAKELLGDQYTDFKKLQSLTGKLSESANAFLNTSQSATSYMDYAMIAKGLADITSAFGGNPWPLAKTGSFALSAKMIAGLMGDKQFLRLVEDALLKKGDKKDLGKTLLKLKPYLIKAAASETEEE